MSHPTLPHKPRWLHRSHPFSHQRFRSLAMQFFTVFCLSIVLLTQLLGNATVVAASSKPPVHLPIPQAHFTLGQFLKQGSAFTPVPNAHIPSAGSPAVQHNGLSSTVPSSSTQKQPPSADPPTMQATSAHILAATFNTAVAGASSSPVLHLAGSDPNGVRMEVTIPAGALDFSSASTSSGTVPRGDLTVTLTQLRGHFITATRELATYQLQITDAQGQVLKGLTLRLPVVYTFHYRKSELSNLLIDPNHLYLSFPALAQSARDTLVPLTNHAATSTLTASVSTLAVTPFAVTGGNAPIQEPPKPRFASVQGNSGQLSYSYPLTVAPGPQGVTPQLQLTYSSGAVNGRHEPTTPAGYAGDGWDLSLGSISAEQYPDGTIWYSLSGIDGVSDRLIPNKNGNGDYATEHMSYLKISRINNPVVPGRFCFRIWDTSGNQFELGCTTDSLLSYHDSDNDQFDYAFHLDKVVAANEGSGTNTRTMTISYLQDIESESGHTSVRDAAPQQIIYSTTANGNTTRAGTVDFFYNGPSNSTTNGIQFETQYSSSYESACGLPAQGGQPQRCDDPIDRNGVSDPAVMSTLELTTVKSYVGDDSSTSHLDYSYALTYLDTPFLNCPSADSNLSNYWCAGDHVLKTITPTVYQNGSGHPLAGMSFSYADQVNKYDDFTQNPHYHMQTQWAYLVSYHDHSTGAGATSITYSTAWNNSHGTPFSSGDNRTDTFYCNTHPSDCTSGAFNPPDDQMWTEQAVTQITSAGQDSSNSNLSPSIVRYDYWLAQTQGSCPADSQNNNACVGFGWMPNSGDSSSAGDFYHGEFRGFGTVLITVPSGDDPTKNSQPYNLTVQKYAATFGWGSSVTDPRNYLAGTLQEEDVYQGPFINGSKLIAQTVNSYGGQNSTANACSTNLYTFSHSNPSYTYTACEVVLLSSKTTHFEQTGTGNANAPWVQKTSTYDDYSTSSGLDQSNPPKFYHNTLAEVVSGSNVPTSTHKFTYATTNTTVSGTIYYNVHSVAHSELDDSSGTIWQCRDIKYDEGVASGVPTPAQGLPTTVITYTNGCNTSSAITTYTGYDADGNPIATVDGMATSSAGVAALYNSGSAGCNTVTPRFLASAWTAGRYTSCTAYSAANALKTDSWNVYSQHTQTAYDATQGLLPSSVIDANSQTTRTSYSYDSAGNPTVQVKSPNEANAYTKQSTLKSSCTDSSIYPCLEQDTNSSLYSGAVTQVFYDSMGRKTETLTPGPASNQTTISFTVYNDVNHSTFQSQPLVIAARTTWLDPNDPSVATLAGSATYVDAAGRTIATMDALFSSNGGIACPSLTAYTTNWKTPLTRATTCTIYGLGTVSGDSSTYQVTTAIDANNHVQARYTDVLSTEKVARSRYVLMYSGTYGGTLTATTQTTRAYTALDKPTSVTVTDLAPQTGQTISSVTTTMQYDSLGRMTVLNDPDRGTHTYTYDANGNVLTDNSGTRTIGTSYDLLSRVRCVQDAAPTTDGSGACSNGSHPLTQNTYDANPGGVTWTTFPVGKLTQSITTANLSSDGTQGTVTENMQYDQRGHTTGETMQIAFSGGSLVFPTLPLYQQTLAYNDADQLTTTQTTVGGQPGYTFSQAYDSTTGVQIGLSNTSAAAPTLAALSYNMPSGLPSDLIFKDNTGANLVDAHFSYDGNLRPAGTSTSWTATSGLIFSDGVSYDLAGNVISRATTQAAIGNGGTTTSEVQNFCYDEQNRMVWASNSVAATPASGQTCGTAALSGAFGAAYTSAYVYTHLGQIWRGPLNGTGTQEQYLYCNSGQPHQVTALSPASGNPTCAAPGTSDYNASYDAFGNMSSRAYPATTTGALVYNGLDQMISWIGTTPSSSQQEWYLYDAAGNRVLRRSASVPTGGNPATAAATITVYAFGLEEHVYQYPGSGSSATNTNNTFYYSLGGHLIGMLSGATPSTSFLLTDTLGSVVTTISNTAGSAQVQGTQVYGPYGNKRTSAGTIGTSKGFTGQYADDLTGLDYYVARYYDPVAGRFLSADTVDSNIKGMDPYAYVTGNPETKTDPTGHDAIPFDPSSFFQWLNSLDPISKAEVIAAAVAAAPEVLPVIVGAGLLAFMLFGLSGDASTIGAGAWDYAQQQTMVGGLAKDVENYRTEQAQGYMRALYQNPSMTYDYTKDPASANGAGAILTIWSSTGKSTQYKNFALGFPGGIHAEPQLIDWAMGVIAANARTRPVTTVNMLLYTYTPLCPECRALVTSNTWLMQLYNALRYPNGKAWVYLHVWEGPLPVQRYSHGTDGINIF